MLKNLVKQINLSLLCLSFVLITNLNPSIVIAKTTSQVQVKAIADTTKPVIKLNSAATINVTYGSPYVDAGVTVTDNKDTNLIATVTFTLNKTAVTSINIKIPGTYIIHYNAKDSAGNKAIEVTRTVIVGAATTKTSAPVVSTPAAITIKDFGAHSIDEVGYSTFDSSVAINKAIQNAKTNKLTSVDFGSGRYYAKDINLESNITYFSTQGVELIAQPSIEELHPVLLAYGKSNFTINGLTINGNYNVVPGDDQSGIVLIELWNSQNATISNNYLYQNNYLAIQLANNCNFITIKNNKINDTDCGVETMGTASSNLTIDSNTIYGGKIQKSEPISINNTLDSGLAHDITITNNTVHDKIGGSGISVNNTDTFLIKSNIVYNCAQGIRTEGVLNATITSNNIHNCISGGMYLQCSNSNISNNTISEIYGTGIWFFSTVGGQLNNTNIVNQNTITNVNGQVGSDEAGIRLEYCNSCTIDSNTITDTRTPVLTYSNIQLSGNTNTNNIIENNILGNTLTKSYSIIVHEAINTKVQNNVSEVLDQGVGTTLSNNITVQ